MSPSMTKGFAEVVNIKDMKKERFSLKSEEGGGRRRGRERTGKKEEER